MNSRNIISIIILFILSAFSAPNVNLVSPYIMRGFSKTYSISYHPERFTGYYDIISEDNDMLESGKYTYKSLPLIQPERFNSVGIKEKVEIGSSIAFWAVDYLEFLIMARFRTIFNVYQKGGIELFNNIAIAPFLGISLGASLTNSSILDYSYLGYTYTSYYYGTSIGTRKLVENKYSFELFVSPSYSFTEYFCEREFDFKVNGIFNFLLQEVNIPLGFRYVDEKRIVKFSIKSGIGLHFLVDKKTTHAGKKTTHVISYSHNASVEVNSSYSFKYSYFSAFAEIGFHFGARRYNSERRKQLNFDKEVVL